VVNLFILQFKDVQILFPQKKMLDVSIKNFGNCSLLREFSRFFWLDSLRTSSYIVSHQSNLVQMKIFLTL
jgi:hypothetical protein